MYLLCQIDRQADIHIYIHKDIHMYVYIESVILRDIDIDIFNRLYSMVKYILLSTFSFINLYFYTVHLN